MALKASTWTALGLGVAANYAVLGLAAFAAPQRTADLFGLDTAIAPADVSVAMSLVAVRDLSFGAATFALGRAGRTREMGTVILSSLIVCAWDIYVAWRKGKGGV
jgi:hypothetical protein